MSVAIGNLFPLDWREVWKDAETVEPVGSVYTKREIVDFMLDLAGYRVDAARLAERRVLEPGCGDGAFLAAVTDRLVESEVRTAGQIRWKDHVLDEAVTACDISQAAVDASREAVSRQLSALGCPPRRAQQLADRWVRRADFLLEEWNAQFDLVIGNPPYVRIEDLPRRVLVAYRERYATVTDRADLYVPFFERGLELLSEHGVLAFICANRFTKNKYGEALRKLIADRYHVRCYVNLEHAQPFERDVSAYPAIFVLDRARRGRTVAATFDDIKAANLAAVVKAVSTGRGSKSVAAFPKWYSGSEPWVTTNKRERELLELLASRFPTLEMSAPGTKVGIGVATGADEIFILDAKDPGIEEDRQLPLLMPADISNAELTWSGHYLLNPFAAADDGSLVDLGSYPGFGRHVISHREGLERRHVAKGRPRDWYRTIDRVWPALQRKAKLVIPDIQDATVIGLDDGQYYPHHNLYWVTSDEWPLMALKAILRCSLVRMQVAALSVQMRGGSIRWQAQTLRRLRIPELSRLSRTSRAALEASASSQDQREIDSAANMAFGIECGGIECPSVKRSRRKAATEEAE